MAATVTLSTTTLVNSVDPLDQAISVSSTSGLTPGVRLYIDRELMSVISLGISPWVNVRRGMDGTATSRHASSSTVTIGRADQFYQHDPVGLPPEEVLVSPWINVITGDRWTAEGDEAGPGVGGRWWQKTVVTHDTGALGVRTTTSTP
jgi:hypothetical protein